MERESIKPTSNDVVIVITICITLFLIIMAVIIAGSINRTCSVETFLDTNMDLGAANSTILLNGSYKGEIPCALIYVIGLERGI
jgi:hypothetical protein